MTWLEQRRRAEERLHRERWRRNPQGEFLSPPYTLINNGFSLAFRLSGLYDRGRRNALNFHLNEMEIRHPALPLGLDGMRILFLSDLHAASVPEIFPAAAHRLDGVKYDLAVLGGDYQSFGQPSADQTISLMEPLLAALRPTFGIYGVLGNHDRHDMAGALLRRGVRLLVNQSAVIEIGGDRLVLVGTDDVNCFYTEEALSALKNAPHGFRIALVHSPEFADQAVATGMNLYLAGHTHAGQVCLPGGRPILTALPRLKSLAAGHWNHHGMRGYTSAGLGSGTPPVRFNCRPEMALITLRRIS
ncbi:hypothetical protein A6A04_02010 [Paramagnetospirillum marisnigri]|uniref:Calcineurin-like phosphoesterase domain-containing protein n=1 Tax=Paramagnetospirillum marisnigri TaxID=1285242 RepID=A0A178MQ47_9PROT|nr:metallophosphoesterase [Paramagnetospirillum marisnigri]OAN50205.1 hypothetical protein A6A04_02010 [Paramagnetospirillum marisnigri]